MNVLEHSVLMVELFLSLLAFAPQMVSFLTRRIHDFLQRPKFCLIPPETKSPQPMLASWFPAPRNTVKNLSKPSAPFQGLSTLHMSFPKKMRGQETDASLRKRDRHRPHRLHPAKPPPVYRVVFSKHPTMLEQLDAFIPKPTGCRL